MSDRQIIIIADYTEPTRLNVHELCEVCRIDIDYLSDLIALGIIQPQGDLSEEWMFDLTHVARIKTALRLQQDLEMNLPSVAVVLDLLDENEYLRTRAELLEKHLLR
jgi:chaperone modulatory protein CbpM